MTAIQKKTVRKKPIIYQPFIKWVGGKRGLLSQIIPLLPSEFNHYFEPFIGGGALFFELYSQGMLKNKKVYLSDINAELVNTYTVVKNNPTELIKNLLSFQSKHNKDFYYEMRELDRQSDFHALSVVEKATRFIYLNKTCFNGLYRVNKKGFFNTPMGDYKNPKIADLDTIMNASEALQDANITDQSFGEVVHFASCSDLVYFDPPYYPLNTTSSFTAYNENDFLDEKQKELFTVFEILHKGECFVVHSNSDTEFIRNLYQKYEINLVQANRSINSKASSRGKINEVVIRNV